jgi:sulfur-oxidizing protein SoxZ
MATQPRIRLPKTARKGEVIQIRTLVSHVMESGQRRDAEGKPIPRNIINRFACTFNGRAVFACEIEPAIAANPYLEFSARVMESGSFRFVWTTDDGQVISATERITVRG